MPYHWDFAVVFRHADLLLQGILNTFRLTGTAILIAVPLGMVIALIRLARIPGLAQLAALYTNLFRAAPTIVLIYWFFFALPTLSGIDFSGFTALCLALGLQTAAYMSEVFRGGIASVERGQHLAAAALGMGKATALRYVILPQAVRRMIPIFFTRITELYKSTSLAVAVSYAELVQTAARVASDTFRPVETYSIVALFFFCTIFCASRLMRLLEHRLMLPQ